MKLVIPMAGRGTRVAQLGGGVPKPLIPLNGQPMVSHALKGLSDLSCSEIVVVALKTMETDYGVTALMQTLTGGKTRVILLDDVTEGQLCTVLAAKEFIDTPEDVLIASCDTFVKSKLAADIAEIPAGCEGLISVASLPGEKWSFASIDHDGWVTAVAEKVRISDLASTGLYYFRHGDRFVSLAEELIRSRDTVRGEYFVMPVYRRYLDLGLKIRVSMADEVMDMGTPDGVQEFLRHQVQRS